MGMTSDMHSTIDETPGAATHGIDADTAALSQQMWMSTVVLGVVASIVAALAAVALRAAVPAGTLLLGVVLVGLALSWANVDRFLRARPQSLSTR